MAASRALKLKAHFESKEDLRPIFTSLNGDNSWLLSFPRSENLGPVEGRRSAGKAYFHMVHDPWLNGPEIQLSSLVIHLSLSAPAAANNGADVEQLVREIESAAADAGVITPPPVDATVDRSPIDAILLNFHYGDHLHKPTLLTFRPSIPVLTTTEGAAVVKKMGHFETVVVYKDAPVDIFSGAWMSFGPGGPLPPYLILFRIKGHHELNFITALVWISSRGVHEAILYSPHGMHTSTRALQTLLQWADPPFTTLALLHGLKESWTLNWQTTFGVASGLELYRQSGSKYWINTHSSRLGYGGLVWWLVTDIFRTLEWGLGQERVDDDEEKEEVKVEEVENGDCFVLV